ncbi:hypothetical protein Sp245p_18980 (plasmid) [Azospirillum baldaniorum]|uniref:Uncharacterized protein n=1 Tax=Azospirillum baldaniorum TaxID=1064539 RepID=A0A9P1JUY3_9PROT|nr:hypothetical protein Sp245p_18980 [Azospirillum baldaniorum]CCD00296.1 protein of unknown function [Azospirillum baldaniorum]
MICHGFPVHSFMGVAFLVWTSRRRTGNLWTGSPRNLATPEAYRFCHAKGRLRDSKIPKRRRRAVLADHPILGGDKDMERGGGVAT